MIAIEKYCNESMCFRAWGMLNAQMSHACLVTTTQTMSSLVWLYNTVLRDVKISKIIGMKKSINKFGKIEGQCFRTNVIKGNTIELRVHCSHFAHIYAGCSSLLTGKDEQNEKPTTVKFNHLGYHLIEHISDSVKWLFDFELQHFWFAEGNACKWLAETTANQSLIVPWMSTITNNPTSPSNMMGLAW